MKILCYTEFINEEHVSSIKISRSGALQSPAQISSLILIKKNIIAKLQQLKSANESEKEKLNSELNSLYDKQNKVKKIIYSRQKSTSRKMGEKDANQRKRANFMQSNYQTTINKLSEIEYRLKKED